MSRTPDRTYLFRGGELLVRRGADGLLPLHGDAVGGLETERRREYPAGGLHCVAAALPVAAQPEAGLEGIEGLEGLEGIEAVPFRAALAELPREEARRAAKGLALLNWLAASRFCGACGAALVDDELEGYLAGARRCPSCDKVHYPRLSPAVIVLVRRGDKALFAHNASFAPGRFGLVAGFAEPGESLEETARREIAEETGLSVGELRYRGSQPWPFPDSLMIGFEADWAGGEARPDGVELDELRWCGPDELPAIPPHGSIARTLIEGWLAELRGRPREA